MSASTAGQATTIGVILLVGYLWVKFLLDYLKHEKAVRANEDFLDEMEELRTRNLGKARTKKATDLGFRDNAVEFENNPFALDDEGDTKPAA